MESEQSRGCMLTVDPHAADPTKVTASLVREARSLLRRADKLASAVRAADDTVTTRLAAEARRAVEQLVHQLTHLQQTQQRRAREAVRRGRFPPR
ncbi:MAG: hypothetical protein ABI352_05380 [Candidatus Dormibacter sp.]